MNEPNVLAVLNTAERSIIGAGSSEFRPAMREAIAAVAELIEAADYVARYVTSFSALTYSPEACREANERLRAALARVGG